VPQVRLDNDSRAAAFAPAASAQPPFVYPVLPDDEFDAPPLPRDHPHWIKDALSVSHHARRLIARLRPIVSTVLAFWDHRVRSVMAGGRRVSLDASGSYRID